MTPQADPEVLAEYFADCACLPDPLQPHEDRSVPGPHLPWAPVCVPDGARTLVAGLAAYGG
ncbi:MAG TPA: hypothetical protein VLJ59_19755 [Mycobacteriales bacterium]|nr:hypothetical protein [Mycobacteriales bacterium]